MNLEKDFEREVTAHFSAIAHLLDQELMAVANSPQPADTKFFLFEYDSPHFAEEFAVSVWAMTGAGEATAEMRRLLVGKAVAVPSEIYDAPKYEELEPWGTASELLETWFATRWGQVNRASSTFPAVIGHHDSYFKTDLLTGIRVSWDEILRRYA